MESTGRIVKVANHSDSKVVANRTGKWLALRGKKPGIIMTRVLLQILNGVWKAHRRNQTGADVWIVSETESRPGKLSFSASLGMNATKRAVEFLQILGFSARIVEDGNSYLSLSSHQRAMQARYVYQLGVSVGKMKSGDVKLLRRELFEGFKKLPKKERQASKKKKHS